MTDQPQSAAPAPQPYLPYPGPAWAGTPAVERRSSGLGLASMYLSLPLFVLSITASVVVGMNVGRLASRTATGFQFNSSSLTPEQASAFAPIGLLMGAQLLLGTAIGILALVLGIVAVSTRRGRPYGVVGVVVAGATPIVSFVVYAALAAATRGSA
jgi:hypothetical protein